MTLRAEFAALMMIFAVFTAPLCARANPVSPQQRQAIEGIIHDYLLHHPHVLIDALRNAEKELDNNAKARTATTIKDRSSELFDDPASPIGGNPHGQVSLVEFFDYQCPYCKRVQPEIARLVEKNRQVRLVYKEFPILGPASVTAARAALAARRQGKYAAFHAAMMARTGEITDATVYEVAASVGIDMARLKHDMASSQIKTDIKANFALAKALGITGTPAFVIGDRLIPGAIDFADLERLVADAGKHAGG